MKKKVIIITIIIFGIISSFVVIHILSNNSNSVRNKDYGDIIKYALEDDDWDDYVTFSDKYENVANYTISKHIDFLMFSQKFNNYLDNNPTYFLNQNYRINISFDFKEKNRHNAMILKNYEDGINNIGKHLYTVRIMDWAMVLDLSCTDYTLGGIECIEVNRSELNQYYESIIYIFPNVKRVITDSVDEVINEKIIEYAKEKGIEIVIEYRDI